MEKKVYLSSESIESCVNYFSSIDISSPEQLGMFFFFKSIGFSEKEYKAFQKVKYIEEEQKRKYLTNLYNLSAIFDKTEKGEEKCCLFPFAIREEIGKTQFFNQATPFKKLLSRMRDTVDNSLIDDKKFLRKDNSNPDNFKFPRNYIQILQKNFLDNKRVSLVYFAAWYFRFRGIECPVFWLDNSTNDFFKEFTRVCTKTLIEELNLTEDELSELFYEDENELISYSLERITGKALRGNMKFSKDSFPQIKKIEVGDTNYMMDTKDIELKITEKLAQPTGNNITLKNLKMILQSSKQIILYGAPGTSKSYITNEIKNDYTESTIIQFHASLTYEQFIGGISVDEHGKLISKPGIFMDFCQKAKKDENTEKKYLFIIDEINRGNISKIFGETILALDRGYEVGLASTIKWEKDDICTFSIPSNVYIIATMNSADRSIAQIDYAIRRRFAFIKFYTNYELIADMSDLTLLEGIKPDILLKSINNELLKVLKDENMLLGHAYFIPKWAIEEGKIKWTPEVLRTLINYYVLPIIEEYTYGNSKYLTNIMGDAIKNRIEDDELFIAALKNQFRVS